MHDVLTFAVLWSLAVTALVALPMTAVIARAVVSSREPPDERRARRLYRLLLEEEIHGEQCFACRGRVEPDWLRCPTCATRLRGRCEHCAELVRLHWTTCPFCLASLERPAEPVGRRVEGLRAAAA